ncbi:hypothetical protein M378DRAFT_28853 [Amanita muscaria Koide BX008]|uniref:Uncharacterized protein n=1 Tax=Amanita muscaria (strain Koide BX008) TaxID=946122 RepID=A0A0C2RU99_AMAMK|nr:hypothetical protein M378DRAFT_28853 [Amanita muscaria Koide BX008]
MSSDRARYSRHGAHDKGDHQSVHTSGGITVPGHRPTATAFLTVSASSSLFFQSTGSCDPSTVSNSSTSNTFAFSSPFFKPFFANLSSCLSNPSSTKIGSGTTFCTFDLLNASKYCTFTSFLAHSFNSFSLA